MRYPAFLVICITNTCILNDVSSLQNNNIVVYPIRHELPRYLFLFDSISFYLLFLWFTW